MENKKDYIMEQMDLAIKEAEEEAKKDNRRWSAWIAIAERGKAKDGFRLNAALNSDSDKEFFQWVLELTGRARKSGLIVLGYGRIEHRRETR